MAYLIFLIILFISILLFIYFRPGTAVNVGDDDSSSHQQQDYFIGNLPRQRIICSICISEDDPEFIHLKFYRVRRFQVYFMSSTYPSLNFVNQSFSCVQWSYASNNILAELLLYFYDIFMGKSLSFAQLSDWCTCFILGTYVYLELYAYSL